jgi:hypothetical protein
VPEKGTIYLHGILYDDSPLDVSRQDDLTTTGTIEEQGAGDMT